MYKKRVTSGLRCCELVKDRINENFRHRENFAPQANFGRGRRRQKLSKFSIAICKNCVGKMLIIMELLLNNYLGHFLIIEKTFVFLFVKSAIKPIPLLHANFKMPWHTECNRLNWCWPECFYEPESPVTTPKSGQRKLPIHNIQRSYGWMHIHTGSDKSAAHGRTWVF